MRSKYRSRWLILLCLFVASTIFLIYVNKEEDFVENDAPISVSRPIDFTEEEYIYRQDNANSAKLFHMKYAQVDSVDFFIEEGVPEEIAYEYIDRTIFALKKMGYDDALKVYLFDGDSVEFCDVREKEVFCSVPTQRKLDFYVNLVLACNGHGCKYGLAHGYANYLFGERTEKAEFLSHHHEDTLEEAGLSLLCFDDKYSPYEVIESSVELAYSFTSFYIKEYGVDAFVNLLKDSGNVNKLQEVHEIINDYCKGKYILADSSSLLFSVGGLYFDYIVESPEAVFYVNRNYRDALVNVNPALTQNFLHNDYYSIKDFFEINVSQMNYYKELFGLNPKAEPIDVVLSSDGKDSYIVNDRLVHIEAVSSIPHEYIHVITHNLLVNEKWCGEGLAAYFSCYKNAYGMDMLTRDYNNPQTSEELKLYVTRYKEHIGRDIDASTDFWEFDNIITYKRMNAHNKPELSLSEGGENYAIASSFIGYLVMRYGETSVIDYFCKTLDEACFEGNHFEDVVADWKDYIEDSYSFLKSDNS